MTTNNNNTTPRRRTGTKQSTYVKYSDRGFAYAELSQTGQIAGLVPSYMPWDRPSLKDVPEGVLIHNALTNCLELSDPENDLWIPFCPGGDIGAIGLPTDGTYTDGAVNINPSGTVADAVDAINEYLMSSSVITYASHLGTTDGNTDGNLVDPNFSLGRVSSPQTYGNPFYTNTWDNDSNRDITNQTSIVWQLNTGSKITDLQGGSIVAKFINGNDVVLYTETLNPDNTLNTQYSSPQSIIQISNLSTQGNRKEGYISLNIPIQIILVGTGYLRIELEHTVNSITYTHSNLEVFYDGGNAPSIQSQSVSLESSPTKYLSGVKFATISGASYPRLRFQLSVSDMWKNTYRADPIVVHSNSFGITDYVVNYNSPFVTKMGITPPIAPFKFDEDFVYSEVKNITSTSVLNPDQNGNYKQVNFTLRDPFNIVTGTLFNTLPEVLINTRPISSSDTLDLFYDEDYRLELSSSGTLDMVSIHGTGRGIDAWNSLTSLVTREGLQVINGALIYPQSDFSSDVPATNPDYSNIPISGSDLSYVRRLRDPNGLARTNGILRIEGLSESDRTSKNILIEIRVIGTHELGNPIQGYGNEGTGWLSLNDSYNAALFKGDDGDGCLATTQGLNSPYFEFTFGGFSTAYSSNQAIEIRITYKYPVALSKRITRLEITNWN